MVALSIDDGPTLDLDSIEGLYQQILDLGFPTPREVIEDRPEGHGQIDRTRFFGARAVSLSLTLAQQQAAQPLRDLLTPFVMPDARPWLTWRTDTGDRRRIQLRADALSAPFQAGPTALQVSWKAPTALIEAADQSFVSIGPSGDAPGITFPITFPLEWPAGGGFVSQVADNPGTVSAPWMAQIFGPCTDPVITDAHNGAAIVFDGLTIAGGDYVELDTVEHTAYLNGDPTLSRLLIDFTATTWWQIPPGGTEVTFTAASATPPAQVLLFWRPTFLL